MSGYLSRILEDYEDHNGQISEIESSKQAGLKAFAGKPVEYAEQVLKVALTEPQKTIIRALHEHPCKMLVPAGHSLGKSFIAAVAANYWYDCFDPSVVITTGPTERDVKDIIWTEIRLQRQRVGLPSNFIGPSAPHMQTSPEHYAKGFTARRGESFSGRHRDRMLFIFDEACHDDQTDVMTEFGWRRFADLDGSERLMTMDQSNDIAEYVLPVRVIKKAYQGKMLFHDGRTQNFCVTPDHIMLWKRGHYSKGATKYGSWQRSTMEQLCKSKSTRWISRKVNWHGQELSEFVLPAHKGIRKSCPERTFPMDDWIRLVAWYCSEGHLFKIRGTAYGIGITQKNAETRREIFDLCERLGLRPSIYNCSTPQIGLNSVQIGHWAEQFGRNCLEKRIPDFIKQASPRQICIFLDTFVRGDGYNRRKHDVYYSSSPHLADDLQELVLKTGGDSTVRTRKLKGKVADFGTHKGTSSTDGFVISRVFKNKLFRFMPRHVKAVDYDGLVYCATLPKHNLLLTRRDGRPLWSGNCGIDPIYWDTMRTMFDASQGHAALAIFNPTSTTSRAYIEDMLVDEEPDNPPWARFRLSALDHPNIAAELKGLPKPIPGAVSIMMVDEWIKVGCEPVLDLSDVRATDIEWPMRVEVDGVIVSPTLIKGSPYFGADIKWWRPQSYFQARALGLWPSQGDGVWSDALWAACSDGPAKLVMKWPEAVLPQIGCDTAMGRGDDFHAAHGRWGNTSLIHETANTMDPHRIFCRLKEMAAYLSDFYNKHCDVHRKKIDPKQVQIKIDDDGTGGAIVSFLRADKWNAVGVGAGTTATDSTKYPNKRSELWFTVAERASRGKLDLRRLDRDTKRRLRQQLMAPAWSHDRVGRRVVEPKEVTKEKIGRSPDDADGLNLSYAEVASAVPKAVVPEIPSERGGTFEKRGARKWA